MRASCSIVFLTAQIAARSPWVIMCFSSFRYCISLLSSRNHWNLLTKGIVLLYLQNFDSMKHFKQELVAYLDYHNNYHIKAKLKGLPPAIHRQQALSAA